MELVEKDIPDTPLEDYIGCDTPIKHECINGHITERAPSNVVRGFVCSLCVNNKKRTPQEYKILLSDSDIIAEESYINTDTPIKHRCKKCDNVWKVSPKYIIGGRKCPSCESKSVGAYSPGLFKNRPDICDRPAILYCVVLVNKNTLKRECVKIGITQGTSNKDVLERASHFSGYDVRIQKLVFGPLEEIYYLENYLHELWSDHRYMESHKFGGYRELFLIDKLQDIIKSIPKNV